MLESPLPPPPIEENEIISASRRYSWEVRSLASDLLSIHFSFHPIFFDRWPSSMPGEGMCMGPRFFHWSTIAGRCWPGALRLPRKVVSGRLGSGMPKIHRKSNSLGKFVLSCLRRKDSASRTYTLGDFSRPKRSPKNIFDRGSQGCRIISAEVNSHPWSGRLEVREKN